MPSIFVSLLPLLKRSMTGGPRCMRDRLIHSRDKLVCVLGFGQLRGGPASCSENLDRPYPLPLSREPIPFSSSSPAAPPAPRRTHLRAARRSGTRRRAKATREEQRHPAWPADSAPAADSFTGKSLLFLSTHLPSLRGRR